MWKSTLVSDIVLSSFHLQKERKTVSFISTKEAERTKGSQMLRVVDYFVLYRLSVAVD